MAFTSVRNEYSLLLTTATQPPEFELLILVGDVKFMRTAGFSKGFFHAWSKELPRG